MKITYVKMTNEAFDSILDELAQKAGVMSILAIDGVRELVQEELNNEVLDEWVRQNPELAQDWSKEEAKINAMDRGRVVELLQDVAGCECYDDEDITTLRTALLENVKDGTVPDYRLEED
jgi:hypothetical protein